MELQLEKRNPSFIFPQKRFLVPDLSPKDRKFLEKIRPRFVFVAKSPHVSEIEPDEGGDRRPLCGVAGRQWWGLLSELLEGELNQDVSLNRLLRFCEEHRIAVMNAVQYPLDPKVSKDFPAADPAKNLGFNKVSGLYSFKKLKKEPQVQMAIQSLKERLTHPSVANASIHCLGNDSEWFVGQALASTSDVMRLGRKIPHPSAWWRRGGLFGRNAKETLSELFQVNLLH